MLKSDVVKNRKALSAKLKLSRETYGITFTELHKISGLSQETICRIEAGVKSWSVDSQIKYLMTLTVLIAKAKREKPNHFRESSFPEINNFIKEHQYSA